MARRARLLLATLCVAACGGDPEPTASQPVPAAATTPQPNVVLVTWDTVRADHIAAPGTPRHLTHTPHWDRLAAEGVVFVEARSPTPMTLPSHASILTGLQPPAHGARDNGIFTLRDSVSTLAGEFAAAGYQTAAFVSAEVLGQRYGLARGFDHYDDYVMKIPGVLTVPTRKGRETAEATLRYIDKADPVRPIFIWVHLFDPHREWDAPEFFADRFDPYRAEIAYADSQTALLLDGLAGRGRLDDAIVIVTSDHGESLGEHGEATHSFFAYDSTLRVPLLVWSSPSSERVAQPGARIPGPASLVDIAPTLRELVGLAPQRSDGHSLVAQLDGSPVPARDLPIESVAPAYGYGTRPIFGVVSSHGEAWYDLPRRERYDLAADPGQLQNLYTDADAERADALFARFRRDWPPASGRIELDAASRSRLEALGYVTGIDPIDDASVEDPKDWIGLNSFLARKHLLRPPRSVLAEARALREQYGLVPVLVEFEVHLLSTMSRSADSRALLAAAVQAYPDNSELAAKLAVETRRLDMLTTRAQRIERELSSNPDDAMLLRQLAIALHMQQDFKRAAEFYRASLATAPDDLDTLQNLGLVLVADERNAEAIEVLEDLMTRDGYTAEHACTAGRTLAFQLLRRTRGVAALEECRARGGHLGELDEAILSGLREDAIPSS
ncbi:MAG: sulfatase-like hydrolase/transferase [Deltaproteobacteria bacterium]|nr:sulfatase-like hydrolase/transferase [Deltaproteobacteria bacterium]